MDRIIYIHIPKTGGSTMRQILTHNLGHRYVFAVGSRHAIQIPWFFALPQDERDRYRHALGHMRYGIHRLFSSGTARYFTLLRHPIERTLSAYSFTLETPNLPHHEQVKNMSFSEYLHSRNVARVQTNWLLGYKPDDMTTPTYYEWGVDVPDNVIDVIKQRLTDEFAVTGLVERYDETLLMLQDEFKWPSVYYFRGNVTSKRLRYKDLNEEDKRALDELTGPDFEIYDWARARFEAKVEALGEPFQQRLAEFKQRNPAVGERRRSFRRLRRKLRKLLGLKRPRNQ